LLASRVAATAEIVRPPGFSFSKSRLRSVALTLY
jgi:hypothetical protein